MAALCALLTHPAATRQALEKVRSNGLSAVTSRLDSELANATTLSRCRHFSMTAAAQELLLRRQGGVGSSTASTAKLPVPCLLDVGLPSAVI